MPPRSIAIACNSKAGKGNAARLLTWIEHELRLRELKFTSFVDDWPESWDPFSEVWIIGGDGTLNYFINRYPDFNLPLAIFRGGTGNDLAWKLYGAVSKELQLDIALNRPVRLVDAGSCNGKIFINAAGVGFDGEVARSMSGKRLFSGHLAYLMVVIRKIFSFHSRSYRVSFEGETIRKELFMITAANGSRFGGGFMIAPTALVDDGWLDLILIERLNILKRLRYLPVIEKGKHLGLPFVSHFRVKELLIETDSPVAGQMEGELLTNTRFEIKVLPARFNIRY